MFVWTYPSHDTETYIFHHFFLLITHNKTTIQVCIARAKYTSNDADAAPSSSPSKKHWNIRRYPPWPYALRKVFNGRGWACSPFQGYRIGYSQVRCVGDYKSNPSSPPPLLIIAPPYGVEIPEDPRSGYGIPIQVQAVVVIWIWDIVSCGRSLVLWYVPRNE